MFFFKKKKKITENWSAADPTHQPLRKIPLFIYFFFESFPKGLEKFALKDGDDNIDKFWKKV